MNYKKYFKGNYELGVCDCWTLIQDIYIDEHNINLPDYPFAIENNEKDFAKYVKANLVLEIIEKPESGCLIHYSHISEHVGYVLNKKQYIHRTVDGTKVDDIPKRYCKFYKIKEVLSV